MVCLQTAAKSSVKKNVEVYIESDFDGVRGRWVASILETFHSLPSPSNVSIARVI